MNEEKRIWANLKTEIQKYKTQTSLAMDKKKLFSNLINSFISGYKLKSRSSEQSENRNLRMVNTDD
ncbi:hypothetical protein DHW03_01865 [Pedobacter yonginense]|uniref:Uncharacterized protein n=1 Tax=Pedobacter yonginense TaxID=651869 RepID=A0A317EQ77_9SPHI|nr:hypothetical protein DHW03_01865 [Pedobacter yonginense]